MGCAASAGAAAHACEVPGAKPSLTAPTQFSPDVVQAVGGDGRRAGSSSSTPPARARGARATVSAPVVAGAAGAPAAARGEAAPGTDAVRGSERSPPSVVPERVAVSAATPEALPPAPPAATDPHMTPQQVEAQQQPQPLAAVPRSPGQQIEAAVGRAPAEALPELLRQLRETALAAGLDSAELWLKSMASVSDHPTTTQIGPHAVCFCPHSTHSRLLFFGSG